MAAPNTAKIEQDFSRLLPSTATLLREMYSVDMLPGSPNGELLKIDSDTRISVDQGAELHRLVSTSRARSTLEIGLAYGFSTVWILDAASRIPDSHHIAIDPYQLTRWAGVGLQAVNRANFAARFEWMDERSDFTLASMAKKNRAFDFIYVDGAHRFDDVLVDFYLADRVLNVGGLLVFDDLWMPSIQSVVSFVERNRSYDSMFTKVANLAVFRKRENDTRGWQHFVPFNVASNRPTRLQHLIRRLRRLFA